MKEEAFQAYINAHKQVAELRENEMRDIADCMATKSAMPGNYWRDRWVAERKLETAKTLWEMLSDV